MPFELKNVPAIFQRLVDLVNRTTGRRAIRLYERQCHLCRSLEKHERKHNLLMEQLRKADLKLQSDKYEFLKTEIIYLGHIVSKMKLNSKKLETVWQFP